MHYVLDRSNRRLAERRAQILWNVALLRTFTVLQFLSHLSAYKYFDSVNLFKQIPIGAYKFYAYYPRISMGKHS